MGKEAPPAPELLDLSHSSYVSRWQIDTSSFDKQSCYTWMSKKLCKSKPKLLLDVGCGDGTSLLRLYETIGDDQLKIISLEENPECIRAASKKLDDAGVSVEVVERASIDFGADDSHTYTYYPIPSFSEASVTLIQSDVLGDPFLEDFLLMQGKFDAVTAWLIGTHPENQKNTSVLHLGAKDSATYRLWVQNRMYDLADKILKTTGIIQVVDRVEYPSKEEYLETIKESHIDQAKETRLEFVEIDYIGYEPPQSPHGTPMVFHLGSETTNRNVTRQCMVSTISKKL